MLWVVAAAASGDRIAGVLAALSGGAWFDFFLTEPYQRFTIADPDDIEATVLLVLIGLGVTEIALWGRRQQGRAARRSGYLEGVLGAARMVSEGDAPASVLIEVVGHQIADVLGADSLPLRRRPDPRHAHRRSSTTTAWSPAAATPSTSTGSASPTTSTSPLARATGAARHRPLPGDAPRPTSPTRRRNDVGSQCSWPTRSPQRSMPNE